MSLLDSALHALAALMVAAHTALASLGADPSSGATWVACILAAVVAVRLALLPLVVHGVRLARASSGHGTPRLGCLPLLLQLPIWLALYHVLTDVAAGVSVGAMTPELVASLGAATLLGVPLAERGYLGGGPAQLAVVAGLALVAATLSFVTQRYVVVASTVTDGMPEALARAQQLMPALSALGLLVAGSVVPVALLAYWVCNSAWTLGQAAVIRRWFPTSGSPTPGRVG